MTAHSTAMAARASRNVLHDLRRRIGVAP